MAKVEVTFEKIYRATMLVEVPDNESAVDFVMNNGDQLSDEADDYQLEEINVRHIMDMNGDSLYTD